MPRWEPDAVGRLQAAAIDLFAEQGFERTTVAEIAERAGLTKRTFFNHFADKREVLFGPGAERQREIVAQEIAACAGTVPPVDAVLRGLQAAADALFEERRAAVTRRRELIDANPQLREREWGKRAALTDAIADALHTQGVDFDTALLTAGVGVLVQQTAMRTWARATDERPLRDHLSAALLSLHTIIGQQSGRRGATSQA